MTILMEKLQIVATVLVIDFISNIHIPHYVGSLFNRIENEFVI